MRIHVVACALLLLTCVEAGPDETREPPQQLVLEIFEGPDRAKARRGRRVALQLHKRVEVEVGGQKFMLKLTAQPYRVFEVRGVRFEYPRRFTFSHEKDEGVEIWSLEGPSTLVMLQRYDKTDTGELVGFLEADLVQRYGPRTRRSDVTMKLGDKELKGRRLDIRIAGEPLRQELFGFEAGGATYVLLMQDSMTDRGEPTRETVEVYELLRKTMKLK